MTSAPFNNNPTPRQTFTVVPPQKIKPASPPPETSQLQSNPSAQNTQISPNVKKENNAEKSTQKAPWRSLVTVGVIAIAIGAIGFIPIPNYVTGQAKIASRMKARQLLTMPVSGRVKIYVQTNQYIQPGQLIAEIQSDDLDNKLTESGRELERAKLAVNAAQQQLIVSQARLNAAQNNEAIARNRSNRQLVEVSNSSSHPQIRRIEREQEIIPQEIAAIEADISGIEAEIIGLREQVTSAAKTVTAYESLQGDGAIRSKDLWDARAQKAVLEAQIQQRKNIIKAKHHQIEQKQSQIAVKSEQINEAGKQLGDILYNYEDDWAQMRSQTQTARQELEAAAVEIQDRQRLVQAWETTVKQLHQQREKAQIFAEMAGTVTTRDLDLKNNLYLEAGQEILDVVDLKQLTAEVQIRQEDKDLVQSGAVVKFYRQGGTTPYSAIVQDEGISPVLQTEADRQKPMLNVRILIDNEDRLLLEEMDGYAHIQTPKLRVYQKAAREFNKLFNLGKYFPWFAS